MKNLVARLLTTAVAIAVVQPAAAPAQNKELPTAPTQNKSVDKGMPAEPLDLTKFYQATPAQFDKSKNYPWRVVPRGSRTFENVPLAIDGILCLWGESNAKNGLKYPEKVDDIPVNRKFESLYVYHTAFYSSRDGSPVYHLTLKYANDTSSMTTISYGAHLRDWFMPPQEKVSDLSDSKSKMVWSADHPDNKGIKIRFFITPITNPRPALEVKSISLASAKGNTAPCILAMTTGPDGLLKIDKASDK
jgi:hypothetical protein